MTEPTPWPPLHEYAMAHACPTCKAQPGEACDAPQKNASLARADRIQERFGLGPIDHDPIKRMHATRQDVGAGHYRQDVCNAPWTEDRVPGQRYDTIGQSPRKRPAKKKAAPAAGASLDTRAVAIFGRGTHGVHWPYGLGNPDWYTKRHSPDLYEQLRVEQPVKQQVIVAWAERYGLKESHARTECLQWLKKDVSRSCHGHGCQRAAMDHHTLWVQGRTPIAITGAPYHLDDTDRARIAQWIQEDPRLRVAYGAGWYGHGTTQIVIWRADRIETIEPATPLPNGVVL